MGRYAGYGGIVGGGKLIDRLVGHYLVQLHIGLCFFLLFLLLLLFCALGVGGREILVCFIKCLTHSASYGYERL